MRRARGRDAGAASALGAIALLIALTACTPGDRPASSPVAVPPTAPVATVATPSTIIESLSAPWSVVAAGASFLISERDTGRILEFGADRSVREVATIGDVVHGGEGGLLGLAVTPAGDALFAYSTAADGNRVQRYPLLGTAGAWALGGATTIIDGLPAAGTHNGGRIAFGPDGRLYVPVGDAGDADAAQDPDRMNGKILRLEPDGTIPSDNPSPHSPVYSLGHRNVQGIAWSADGRMFASEFGQNTWDELNEIVPGGNYGWPEVEGFGGADAGFVDPLLTWAPAEASPSGIAVVGDRIVIANLRGQVLRVVPLDAVTAGEPIDPSRVDELYGGEFGRLRDVVAAADGTAWVLTNNTDGRGDARDGDDRLISVPLP